MRVPVLDFCFVSVVYKFTSQILCDMESENVARFPQMSGRAYYYK